jgi:hypothetical protein
VKRFLQLATVAAILAFAACSRTEPAQAPEQGRPPFFAFTNQAGTSMLPTFGGFEVIRLEVCRLEDCAARDTVIYWHRGTKQYVHHRLDSRDPTTGLWRARGDNNPGLDSGFVTADVFVGRTHKLTP